jgi:hypothetical protein
MEREHWYEKNFRRNLVDMHIGEWDERFMADFDSRTYVELLHKANITCAMIYANSHAGPCYWPTKQGHMHKGLKGRDILGEVIGHAHRCGMDAVVYYSLIFDNMAYDLDESWRIRDLAGKASREGAKGSSGRAESFDGSRYGLCCPNSPGYRAFTSAQLEDLCAHYDFEGVFFDMAFWPHVCYCDNCKSRFYAETGKEMPVAPDWADPDWAAFQQRREDWMADFALFSTGTIKGCKPKASCNHQFSTMVQDWVRGVTAGMAEAVDYAGGDFYGGVRQQSFVCKLFHSMTGNFEFHTSRCTNLQDHTTMKTVDEIELNYAIALAHGGAFLFIDAIDPEGTLNPAVYETMGHILEKGKSIEPYIGGRIVADAAVFFNTKSKMDLEGDGAPPHITAAISAANRLREAHIPYTVLTEKSLHEGLGAYKAVIIPDIAVLLQEQIEAFLGYAAKGGRLLVSGEAGGRYFADALGMRPAGKTAENVTYVSPAAGGPLEALIDRKHPLAVFERQALMEYGGRAEAHITLPFTLPQETRRFASIHSNPPGKATAYPAIVEKAYGDGLILWTAAPLENYGQGKHIEVYEHLLKRLLPAASIRVDAHRALEVVLFWRDAGSMNVCCLNLQNEFPMIPLYKSVVHIASDMPPAKVTKASDGAPAAWRPEKGGFLIEIETLEVFELFHVAF